MNLDNEEEKINSPRNLSVAMDDNHVHLMSTLSMAFPEEGINKTQLNCFLQFLVYLVNSDKPMKDQIYLQFYQNSSYWH